MPRHDELAVYLVGDDLHVVAQADVVHAFQLLSLPHAPGGIVGIAKQEHRCLRVGAFPLKVVKVHAVGVALPHEFILYGRAAAIGDAGKEAVVYRGLYQHLLPREGESLEGSRRGGNDARGIEYPIAVYGPLMTTAKPVDDGLIIALRHLRVAEDALVHALAQSLGDVGQSLEIHIRHPQWDGLWMNIPLHAARSYAVVDSVEVVFHVVLLSVHLGKRSSILQSWLLANSS